MQMPGHAPGLTRPHGAKERGVLFEIINPSDAYTIEAPDLSIAGAACVLLGNGQYAFKQVDGDAEVPLFLFGGHDEWFREHCDGSLDDTLGRVMKDRRAELADCLDSTLIGTQADREEFHALTASVEAEERARLRAERHDKRRSSLNDIGARAYRMAAALREPQPEPAGA
jgi:hypothetical protein